MAEHKESLRYRNIIWDFDGTLFDTYPTITRCIVKVLAEHGAAADPAEAYALAKDSIGVCIGHYSEAFGLDRELVSELYGERLHALPPGDIPPFPGIPELLRRFRDAGGRSFVFTHRGSSAADILEHHGLAPLFADIVTWRSGFIHKPNPSGNLYIIQKHGLDPALSIAIGDREIDILAGKNAGMAACFFTQGGGQRETAADFQAPAISDIYPILGL